MNSPLRQVRQCSGTRSTLLPVLFLLLAGCSFKPWPVNHLLPPTKLDAISIQSAVNSNAGTVVLLDIVYDFGSETAAVKVPDKAQDWFTGKSSLLFTLKNSIAVSSFEVPPARSLPPVDFPKGYKQAQRVLLFASFQKSGLYFEMDITKMKKIRIDLLEKGMNVITL